MDNISNKTIGIVVGVVLLLVGGYLIYSNAGSGGESGAVLTSSNGANANSTTSIEVIQQLERLRRINLNTDFFDSRQFQALTDFSIQINPQPVGRDNPFAPTGFVPSGDVITPASQNTANTAPPGVDVSPSNQSATADNATDNQSGNATSAEAQNQPQSAATGSTPTQ